MSITLSAKRLPNCWQSLGIEPAGFMNNPKKGIVRRFVSCDCIFRMQKDDIWADMGRVYHLWASIPGMLMILLVSTLFRFDFFLSCGILAVATCAVIAIWLAAAGRRLVLIVLFFITWWKQCVTGRRLICWKDGKIVEFGLYDYFNLNVSWFPNISNQFLIVSIIKNNVFVL